MLLSDLDLEQLVRLIVSPAVSAIVGAATTAVLAHLKARWAKPVAAKAAGKATPRRRGRRRR